MTAQSLTRIVAEELATVGVASFKGIGRWGRPRHTVWSSTLPGFGVRHYSSGRRVYVVQTAMSGRVRTVTIGNANFFTDAEATDVARRILLRAQIGDNPAETAKRVKASPRFDVFLKEFWDKVAIQWKPSTRYNNDCYRRAYLDDAFPKRFVDEITQAEVLKWFVRVSGAGGPGAGNRAFEILRTMMNRAEAWGYREECSNPCRGIRPAAQIRVFSVQRGAFSPWRGAARVEAGLSPPSHSNPCPGAYRLPQKRNSQSDMG